MPVTSWIHRRPVPFPHADSRLRQSIALAEQTTPSPGFSLTPPPELSPHHLTPQRLVSLVLSCSSIAHISLAFRPDAATLRHQFSLPHLYCVGMYVCTGEDWIQPAPRLTRVEAVTGCTAPALGMMWAWTSRGSSLTMQASGTISGGLH